MKVIQPQAARFENTRIYLHRRSQKAGGRVDGRYVRIGGLFKMGPPKFKSPQYMGIDKHLFMTITYPDYIRDLIGIATDLPRIVENGNAIWVGKAAVRSDENGFWYYIPKGVWGFCEGEDYNKTIKTTSIISLVSGEGGGNYYLLEIPLLSRNFLRKRYKYSKRSK